MRFARSSASISCRHMRFARSSVTVDVRRFARIYVEYACTVCMCIYMCVCARVNLHMFEHVYIHICTCQTAYQSICQMCVRTDVGIHGKANVRIMCRNLCHNVMICTCQHVCQDVYTKGGDLNNYRRVILSRSSRNTDIKNM
jgi:hypothetical protein